MHAWLRVRGSHPLRRAVPGTSARHTHKHDAVLLPRTGLATPTGLGSSPFARHYWGNHCCFLFLRVLRCFSSPRSPRRHKADGDRPSGGRVVPFGNPGVKGHLLLTRAYRSLSRPSSPP